jgi:hypothetical protein
VAYTTQTVLNLLTSAFRQLTMIDEVGAPSAEQTAVGLEVLNDMMLNMEMDGLHFGWYPQSSATNIAPLQDTDVRNIKVMLAKELATHYGIEIQPTLAKKIDEVDEQNSKRSVRYVETDLTGLPFSQGGLFGPGRV